MSERCVGRSEPAFNTFINFTVLKAQGAGFLHGITNDRMAEGAESEEYHSAQHTLTLRLFPMIYPVAIQSSLFSHLRDGVTLRIIAYQPSHL